MSPNHSSLFARRTVLAAAGAGFGLAQSSQPALPSEGRETDRSFLNILKFGAIGDGVRDDAPAIQAALDAIDPNRGGRIIVPQGRYRVATGLVVRHQGTELVGEGQPGTSRNIGLGSTRIISDDGITAITCGASDSHATVGYGFRRLHILAADGATKGHGIVVKNAAACIFEDVTCSDYIRGAGLLFDGGPVTGNAQYATLFNFSAGDCLTGLKLQGAAPNGIRLFGGYFEGASTSPRPGSTGILIASGDTFRAFGTVVQGYTTGFHISSNAMGHELHGTRAEFCNVCYRFGAEVNSAAMLGGAATNTLLGSPRAGNVGIVIEEGARDCLMMPTMIDGCATDVIDKGLRTRWVGRVAP